MFGVPVVHPEMGQGRRVIDPPYPATTRARGWRFELDMEAVKASDTWLRARSGEVRGALLMLWAESWMQTPCGSLPDDDELVALLIDMSPKTFARHRAILMRGWQRATDGRLYHDTIASRVQSMLAKRAKDTERAARNRGPKREAQAIPPEQPPEYDASHASVTRDSDPNSTPSTKHQNQAPEPEPEPSKSKPEVQRQKPRKRGAPSALVSVESLVAAGVNRQHADDWLAIRKAKGLPLTSTAWEGIAVEAGRAGMTVGDAIKSAAENSWGGFKSSWIAASTTTQRNGHHGGGAFGNGPKTPEETKARDREAMRLLGITPPPPKPTLEYVDEDFNQA